MTPKSFLIHIGKSTSAEKVLNPACRKLFPYHDEVTTFPTNNFWIGVNGNMESSSFHFASKNTGNNMELWIINDDDADKADRIFENLSEFGIHGLPRIDTTGIVLIQDDHRLILYNGMLGTTPVYYANNEENILITSEAKALAAQDLIPVQLKHKQDFGLEPYFKPPGFCLLKGVKKLDSGKILAVDFTVNSIEEMTMPERISYRHTSTRESSNILYHQLEDIIKQNMVEGNIGVPISGGFDSGVIAAIASKHSEIHTFTMGTESVNEFDSARKMSAYISSNHTEIIIPDDELIPAILHGVFLNELSDPVYAEGYSGLYFVFQEAGKSVNKLLTGYGADLTLGNLLNAGMYQLNDSSIKLINRTSITGELTNYAPAHFGLEVIQPFLNKSVVDYIISMPEDYKVRNGVEKYIEKEMIIERGLMPFDLLDLEKRALHTGAGIDHLFNRVLGIPEDKTYRVKSNFLYYAWKEIIFEGVEPGNVDIDQLVYKAKETA